MFGKISDGIVPDCLSTSEKHVKQIVRTLLLKVLKYMGHLFLS